MIDFVYLLINVNTINLNLAVRKNEGWKSRTKYLQQHWSVLKQDKIV